MKERPILFSAPMVRAILAGNKKQTRRVVKKVVDDSRFGPAIRDVDGGLSRLDMAPDNWEVCPYGVPGDRLYVRETWAYVDDEQGGEAIAFAADESARAGRWRPSIHMPRSASRILLEIVSTRCQRLQDISEEDARAEGVPFDPTIDPQDSDACVPIPLAESGRDHFCALWNAINGRTRGYWWGTNPYVWAIKFRRIAWPT